MGSGQRPCDVAVAHRVPVRLLTVQALAGLGAVLLLGRVWLRFGWGYTVYCVIVLVIPIVGTKDFMGLGRYVLAAFPAFAPRVTRSRAAVTGGTAPRCWVYRQYCCSLPPPFSPRVSRRPEPAPRGGRTRSDGPEVCGGTGSDLQSCRRLIRGRTRTELLPGGTDHRRGVDWFDGVRMTLVTGGRRCFAGHQVVVVGGQRHSCHPGRRGVRGGDGRHCRAPGHRVPAGEQDHRNPPAGVKIAFLTEHVWVAIDNGGRPVGCCRHRARQRSAPPSSNGRVPSAGSPGSVNSHDPRCPTGLGCPPMGRSPAGNAGTVGRQFRGVARDIDNDIPDAV